MNSAEDFMSENKNNPIKSFECRSVGIRIIIISLAIGIFLAGAGMIAFSFEKIFSLMLFAAGFCSVIIGTVQYIRFYERSFCIYSDRITGSLVFSSGKQTSVSFDDLASVRAMKGLPVIVAKTEHKIFRFYVPEKDAFHIAEIINKKLSAKQI